MHFKDIDPAVKADVVEKRTDFYKACGQGIFCNLGQGDVDFPAVRQVLLDARFRRAGARSNRTATRPCRARRWRMPQANREYLQSIGF